MPIYVHDGEGNARDHVPSDVTMMTHECSASSTAGSQRTHEAILHDTRHGQGMPMFPCEVIFHW